MRKVISLGETVPIPMVKLYVTFNPLIILEETYVEKKIY